MGIVGEVEFFLIVLVLVYGCCVLAYNRWSTRRYAASEAQQKEEEAELYPMLTKDDVPFGARALERGVQVEGIWISDHNTPLPSLYNHGTPALPESHPSSPSPRPIPIRPSSPRSSMTFESTRSTRASLPPYFRPTFKPETDIVAASNYTYEPQGLDGLYSPEMSFNIPPPPAFSNDTAKVMDRERIRPGLQGHDVLDSDLGGNDPASRRPGEQHRIARISRVLRRRSSEEFRRKMSAIFNERIHMSMAPERLQFDQMFRDQRRHMRNSILAPIRSWNQ
ncbi:hypothetical protein N7462_000572 [Penicillium macrosclerotiorum]|uniref:uncharacterized protein n=1 Tax=Penicillium macrosclerotiorum TaxID=303699 RepID=UPI002548524D|nr:uncharacterized protein N7462_000572 [Penicillium macrosclerotiorum]KAJ5698567.1 hypothetical protein N7462_000572 [Penicillium macrosclerotiorum]